MDLYQLRTFSAVAEEGHLTRAAERLHLSQPAVSGQIKALESEFELRLFERLTTGMEITGTLRIGTVSDPQTIRVGELLSCAVRRFPGLELELHHEMSGIALENVRDRKLDASFYFGDEPGPGFRSEE